MPDNIDQNTIVIQVRRGTLLSGIALLAVYVSAPASFACGGGPDPEDQSSGGRKKPKAKKNVPQINAPYKENFSQRQFRNLSAADLREHSINSSHYRSTLKIEGFSPRMTKTLFEMAGHDRASTRRLVKDMAKLKTKKTRKAHLRKEINRSDDLDRILFKSIKTLEKSKASKAAIKDEKTRMDDNFDYRYLVVKWARNPMEGTLK